jgi:4-carboxymuconolactone decarboxylase
VANTILASTDSALSVRGGPFPPYGPGMPAEHGSHSPRPASPRIPPLPDSERDARTNALLAGVAVSGPATNIFTTLVRHPGLFRRWLPFGGKLLAGRLPARDRELLILRTGWLCGAEYEWGQHVPLGRQAGLTDAEIAAIQAGPDDPTWSDDGDAALLTAADELHRDACITDGTWAKLAARYDERQLIEIPMVVGHYHLVGFTLNSLGVQLEPGVPGFAEESDEAEEAGEAREARGPGQVGEAT